MNIRRAYKTELKPNRAQTALLANHCGAARFAYNWGLARKVASYELTGKSPGAIDLHRELNALKKTELPWLYEVSKCAPQEALRDLDRAFSNFFRRCELKRQGKLKGKVGFPHFKSRKRVQTQKAKCNGFANEMQTRLDWGLTQQRRKAFWPQGCGGQGSE